MKIKSCIGCTCMDKAKSIISNPICIMVESNHFKGLVREILGNFNIERRVINK